MWITVALALVLALVVLGWYVSSVATRLDRLHRRVEGAHAALDTQLVRRAQAALELAGVGRLDPAAALLLTASAADAVGIEDGRLVDRAGGLRWNDMREAAESDLSRSLRAALGPEQTGTTAATVPGRELLEDVAEACHRAVLARRFFNDAVTQAWRVRRKRLVIWLRLAGNAALPQTFEADLEPPAPLEQMGAGPEVRGGP